MKARAIVLGAAIAASVTGGAWADKAADKPKTESCFLSSQWQGWRAPDDHTLYLRVNIRDIYKVELSAGSNLLTWPDVHLVNVLHGGDYICSPLDLQFKVVDNGGVAQSALIAKSITKLTPEQVAAIPKKDLP